MYMRYITCDNIRLYPDNEIAQQGSSVCNKRIQTHNYIVNPANKVHESIH